MGGTHGNEIRAAVTYDPTPSNSLAIADRLAYGVPDGSLILVCPCAGSQESFP